MRRKLNIRFVLWTVASLVVVSVCVHFLHAFQVRRNAGALLRQAERLVTEENLDKASFYFGHYLQFQPDDASALVKYALTIDKLATHQPARTHAALVLDQAFRKNPGNSEIGLKLVHQQIAIGRYAEAISNLDKLRGANLPKGEIEHLLGWAYEARGAYASQRDESGADFNRSVEWLTKAVEAAPEQMESYLFLVHVFANRLNNIDEASKVFDKLVEANKTSHRAFVARARFHKQTHRSEAAEKDLQEALRLAPKEADVLLLTAQWDLEKDDFAGARKHIEQGLALHPEAALLYYTLAQVELKTDRRKEAIAVLRRGLTKVSKSADLIGLLADTILDDGEVAEVQTLITDLRKLQPDSGVANYLQARVLAGQGKWSEAIELSEKALGQLNQGADWTIRTLVLLGRCWEQTGDAEQQLAACQRALAHDANSTAARLGVARAYLTLGRPEDALTELATFDKATTPPPEKSVLIARAHLLRMLQMPDAQRDWAKVDTLLDDAEKQNPSIHDIVLLRAGLGRVPG